MNFKKLMGVILALALLCSAALAEGGTDAERIAELEAQVADLEGQLAEKDGRIAELEAELEARNYVVTFDGGFVTVEEAAEQYAQVEYMFSMYGYSMDGYEDYYKQEIMTMLAQQKVVALKAEELGLTELTDEKKAELEASAQSALDQYVANYRADFEDETKTEEEIVAATVEFLAGYDISFENLYQQEYESYVQNQVFAYVADQVELTDEELQAAFDAAVATDLAQYSAGGTAYESARTAGTAIYWNPEGFRQVKHVLIKFDDDQASRYSALNGEMTALETELESAQNPTEGAETEPRAVEDIQADIDAKQAEIDALYAELSPKATEVVEKFNAGTPFDELISEYNADPGMTSEPTATEGYAVSAASVYWDPAFTSGAMSIEAVGGISEPVFGTNGIHIIYYLADVTPGAVAFDDVKEELRLTTLDNMRNEAYTESVNGWCEELNVTYFMENFD